MNSGEATSDHFDLLPFISILMCVLGCLLLVTISISAISIGAGAAEAWTPQGIGSEGTNAPAKDPILVEWDGKVATFQLQKRSVLGEWSEASPKGNAAFQGALKSVATRKDRSYLLVAVRPSGFTTLLPLLDVLRDAGLDVGYEPVEQGRSVTLKTAKAEPPKASSPSDAQPPSPEAQPSATEPPSPKAQRPLKSKPPSKP